MDRECPVCQSSFTTPRSTKIYCSDACRKRATGHQARSTARNSHTLSFVGVDGEGVDRPDGRHEYVMLSVGDRTLTNNGDALTIGQILSFLWECYQGQPDACYVGFFLGYDFIQWEKLLPESVARSLLTAQGIAERTSQVKARANPFPDPVVFQDWEIDIMAGRRFKLRPHTHRKSKYAMACANRTCRHPMEERDINEPCYDDSGNVGFERVTDVPVCSSATADQVRQLLSAVQYPRSVLHGSSEKRDGWLYICDTGPFWQTSFLNVINPASWEGVEPVCTPEEYAIVLKGKSDRGTVAEYGSVDYLEEMARYNILENTILARVTARLNEGFANSEISIKIPRTDWYGPGRAAQLWMDMLHSRIADSEAVRENRQAGITVNDRGWNRRNEKGLLNADVYMSVPAWFVEAARASYYGGWFEQTMHGHVGNVWEYDINSAYPFIIASLPCLHTEAGHTGSYQRGNAGSIPPASNDRYTLILGRFEGSNPYLGGLPYRTARGSILRPHVTRGWYWQHEIDAAIAAGLIDTMEVEEWVSYRACHCQPPFNPSDIGIEKLYELRLRVGKNSPQGKSAKLVYNSAYGKTAQSIGRPKYSNPVYASLITAGCRTLILRAISTHPMGAMAVSMVATDGVYFTSRHTSLPQSKTTLGLWDETFKPGMTQLMPGVYWDDNTREGIRDGKSPKLKSRGVNARDLATEIATLDHLFAVAQDKLSRGNGEDFEWPELHFTVGFLLTSAKSALHRDKWGTAGTVQHHTTRVISADPRSKRNPIPFNDANAYTRTTPYRQGPSGESTTPYSKSFGHTTDGVPGMFGDDVTQDGLDPMTVWRDMLNV